MEWKNRIIGHGSKPASKFQAHPNNWRKHPARQCKAVKGSLDDLGWIDAVIENVRTGRLIDGHERVWQAMDNGDAEVPYIQVDLSEAEEAQALLSLDAIAALAESDAEKIDALLHEVHTDNADVMQFLEEMAKDNGIFLDVEGIDAPELRAGDRAPFQQMTFTLHDSQAETVKEAIEKAQVNGGGKSSVNQNSNSNALAQICELFLNG